MMRQKRIPTQAPAVLRAKYQVFSGFAYLKCRPAEKAILKLLKRKSVRKTYWNINLPTFFRTGTFIEIPIRIRETRNSTTSTKNMILILERKEAQQPIAITLGGTIIVQAEPILQPFKYFHSSNGLRYKLTNQLSARLKYANCKTPKSSNPTILTLISAKKRIMQLMMEIARESYSMPWIYWHSDQEQFRGGIAGEGRRPPARQLHERQGQHWPVRLRKYYLLQSQRTQVSESRHCRQPVRVQGKHVLFDKQYSKLHLSHSQKLRQVTQATSVQGQHIKVLAFKNMPIELSQYVQIQSVELAKQYEALKSQIWHWARLVHTEQPTSVQGSHRRFVQLRKLLLEVLHYEQVQRDEQLRHSVRLHSMHYWDIKVVLVGSVMLVKFVRMDQFIVRLLEYMKQLLG